MYKIGAYVLFFFFVFFSVGVWTKTTKKLTKTEVIIIERERREEGGELRRLPEQAELLTAFWRVLSP